MFPIHRVAGAKDSQIPIGYLGPVSLCELGGDEGVALDDEISLEPVVRPVSGKIKMVE